MIPLLVTLLFLGCFSTNTFGNATEQSNLPKECLTKDAPFETLKSCAEKYFVVYGEAINPKIIEELNGLISDSHSQVISIDLLNSQNSNRFFNADPISIEKHGQFYKVTKKSTPVKDDAASTFSYAVEGHTKNGIYIIKTVESGGGSGVFPTLLFLKLREDKSLDVGKLKLNKNIQHIKRTEKRLLLDIIGSLALGDRSQSTISIKENSLFIEKENHLDEKKESLILELGL
jgi:hypothetical protein